MGWNRRARRTLFFAASAMVVVLLAGVAVADPPNPLPWLRQYVSEAPISSEQFATQIYAQCDQDLERGLRQNAATGVPRIAVLGDSVEGQTRAPALADPSFHWMYATHCGEKLGTALSSGRLADAVNANPDVLVIALGSNNLSENWVTDASLLGGALDQLKNVLDATESVRCRVVFDLAAVAPSYAGDAAGTWLWLTQQVNNAIYAAQSRHGVHIAPWRDRVGVYPPAYLQDGLHLTGKGINERINIAIETARQCLAPDSPAHVGAIAGNGTATVWWDPLPDAEKVTSYVVTASDGRTVTTTQPTVNFPGLVNGQAYSFRVHAVNAGGAGPKTAWTGSVVPSAAGARFHASTPVRVLDTRYGTGGKARAFGPGESYRLTLPPGAVPAGASAAVLNVTATGQTQPTFITVWPGGQSRPLASNLNPAPGVDAVPAMVTTRVAPDGSIQLFNNAGSVHLIADVVGWYGATGDGTGSLYAPLAPVRVLDTRAGIGGKSTAFTAGQVYQLPLGSLPAGASAAVLNVTAPGVTAPTHITLWPTGQQQPLASSLNPQPGITRANLTVAKVGSNAGGPAVSVYNNSGSTDLVIDLVGYYTANAAPSGGSLYYPITPERAYDTRVGAGGVAGPIPSATSVALLFSGRGAVPASGVVAVDANLTVTDATTAGHTTVWPSGSRPEVSALNYRKADVVANRDLVTLAGGGALAWSNASSIQYVVDVSGWFGPAL